MALKKVSIRTSRRNKHYILQAHLIIEQTLSIYSILSQSKYSIK
jgi:hypothetical protein